MGQPMADTRSVSGSVKSDLAKMPGNEVAGKAGSSAGSSQHEDGLVKPLDGAGSGVAQKEEEEEQAEFEYGWRFWAIFPGFCIISLVLALDATILSTVMPTISNSLHSGPSYVWIINGYFISSTAIQPLMGQSANIFGRRPLTLLSILLFALGSTLCATAQSTPSLIAGRVVKGLGGGGINVMTEVVIADMVPLRQRQKYMGIIYSVFAIGTFIGPILGGVIVEATTWRWVFWINLPICGAGLVLMFFFLRVRSDRSTTVMEKLKRIDWLGNGLIMGSVVAMLMALTWAGTAYAWSSWRVLVPLVLGLAGTVGYMFYQASSWCVEPTTPPRLFLNRTSALGFVVTFFHSVVLYWLNFFLPVYFQAVLEASPRTAGVYLLAIAVPMMPSAVISGILIAKTGRYKPPMVVGFVLYTLGVGLLVLWDEKTRPAVWIVIQIVTALGCGVIMTASLPTVLTPLPEADVATAIATAFFIRNLGCLWGVAIPSAIFNIQVTKLAARIASEPVRQLMYNGGAYERASSAFIQSFNDTPEVKAQIVSVYVDSLRLVWQVAIAFAAVGIPLSFWIKEIKMRDHLDTEFGLEDKKTGKDVEKNGKMDEKSGQVDEKKV